MMTRSEWDRLQYEYFQRLIDENRGQRRQGHRAAQVVVAVGRFPYDAGPEGAGGVGRAVKQEMAR